MDTKIETLPITTDELVGALDALNVPFLAGGIQTPRALALSDSDLLLGLARDPDARVALAVIPLLLVHPECAEAIPGVVNQLEGDARLTFECYCTAAYWLQRQYERPITELVGKLRPLPDWFSAKLGLSSVETDARHALVKLGLRHQALSHERLNWHGTYEHAAQSLIKQLTWERAWQS
jgi:hypothetical protein